MICLPMAERPDELGIGKPRFSHPIRCVNAQIQLVIMKILLLMTLWIMITEQFYVGQSKNES